MNEKIVKKLTNYIEALRPIIYLEHFDFHMTDELISEASKRVKGTKVIEYNDAYGCVYFDTKIPMSAEITLKSFLEIFAEESGNIFLVLKDMHNALDKTSSLYDPKIIALLKSVAMKRMFSDDCNITIFLVSPVLVLPKELEKIITVFNIPLPNEDEVKQILTDYEESYNTEIKTEDKNDIVLSLKGLTEFEIRQILFLAYSQSGNFDRSSIKLVLREKEQIIKKSGIVEIISSNLDMNAVGGLENLKKYLNDKSKIFSNLGEAQKFGIDLPKGILIMGMPGCGKSLTAKATAAEFNVPLLRLDIGKIMGKYVGESEHNLSEAIKVAEAVAPCVLWIDELEKAFAGVGGQGGGSDITTRLFGHFLTWLQEKDSSVYVVATSNDISNLPSEFLRRGRFDESFLVELPSEKERENIFSIHLKKRGKLSDKIEINKLASKTEGYSGADIENVVKETIETVFCSADKSVTTQKLLDTIANTKSFSETMSDKVEDLRQIYKKYNLKKAN